MIGEANDNNNSDRSSEKVSILHVFSSDIELNRYN